jgi:hypothetical protein
MANLKAGMTLTTKRLNVSPSEITYVDMSLRGLQWRNAIHNIYLS